MPPRASFAIGHLVMNTFVQFVFAYWQAVVVISELELNRESL